MGGADATGFPVLCGSASNNIAIDRLATFICKIGPSPADRPPAVAQADDGLVEVPADPSGEPLVYVFKTLADPYVGKVSMFRVISGTIRPDVVLMNPRTQADERLHALFTMLGKEHIDVSEVPAGDIAAVGKLSDTATGDTLAPKGTPITVPALEMPDPLEPDVATPEPAG